MLLPELHQDELPELYAWVDSLPLSKPKKSINRDFSDGVCMAETIHCFFPRLVDLHNYTPASNTATKFYNWNTLNQRVFRRLGFTLDKPMLEAVAMAEAGVIERILKLAREKMALLQERRAHSRLSQYNETQQQPYIPGSAGQQHSVLYTNYTMHINDDTAAHRPDSSSLVALAQPNIHPPDVSTSWFVPQGQFAAIANNNNNSVSLQQQPLPPPQQIGGGNGAAEQSQQQSLSMNDMVTATSPNCTPQSPLQPKNIAHTTATDNNNNTTQDDVFSNARPRSGSVLASGAMHNSMRNVDVEQERQMVLNKDNNKDREIAELREMNQVCDRR